VAGRVVTFVFVMLVPASPMRASQNVPVLTGDGRAAVIAPGTPPIPIGIYAMIFSSYPTSAPPGAHGHSQFGPMTTTDWTDLAGNGYISGE
jgi:hypothetical protein